MQIGLGDPIGEEIEKIKAFWQNFKQFAKTKKFILLASLVVVLLVLIGIIAILSQIPPKPVPPKTITTPMPITFPTPTPEDIPRPLSAEAASLSKQFGELNYNDPNLAFPELDWKINLK